MEHKLTHESTSNLKFKEVHVEIDIPCHIYVRSGNVLTSFSARIENYIAFYFIDQYYSDLKRCVAPIDVLSYTKNNFAKTLIQI